MSYTQFGRVEMDPMQVPIPARSSDDTGFEQALFDQEPQQASRLAAPGSESEANREAPGVDPDGETPEAPAPVDPGAERSAAAAAEKAGTQATKTQRPQDLPAEGEEVALDSSERNAKEGVPARRTNAGKHGSGAPTSFRELPEFAEVRANQQRGATGSEDAAQVAAGSISSAATGVGSKASGANTGTAAVTGEGRVEASDRLRSPQAATGYRSLSKHLIQMAESNRDSIFKQIAMKLGQDGGELSMRLDPPELGKLDLQMVVENGNQMRLLVSAERPELAQLIDRHMHELRAELEAQGITITDAEIRGQDQSADRDASELANEFGSRSGNEDTAKEEPDQPAQDLVRPGRGFITAEGLDFWA